MIKTKDGSVNVSALHAEMYFVCGLAEAVFAKYGLDAVITSAADSTHNPGSLHAQGKAIDLRWSHVPESVSDEIFSELSRRLERRGFDVVDERTHGGAVWTGAHVHIEFQPKGGELFWR